MKHVTAVISMLHENRRRIDSARRLFRGESVLSWTLERVGQAERIDSVAVLCWEEQLSAVEPIADAQGAYILAKGPTMNVPQIEAIAASRRWCEGWRGGLLGTCSFDQGFFAPWVLEVAQKLSSDAVLLVDPAAGLVDPALLDGLLSHAADHDDQELIFAPAAPGLAGALIRTPLLERLAKTRGHPGRHLHYWPELRAKDPIAGEACAPVPTKVARTTHVFTLDTNRRIAAVEQATASLNGELLTTQAEQLVHHLDQRLQSNAPVEPLPREIVLEINTERASNPIYWPGRHLAIQRPPMPLAIAEALFAELSEAEDIRLTLTGVGDPLLAPDLFEIIAAARAAGIEAIHIETDLLGVSPERIKQLAASAVDVVSIHLPAITPTTYAAVMGADALPAAIENLKLLLTERTRLGRGVPILAPTFTKCALNLAEMEPWYDQWLSAVGCAVIAGPSAYAGQIPDAGVADMSPPARKPCRRLSSRLTILCDGRIVTCEQDILGKHVVGVIGQDTVASAWQKSRGDGPLCPACREWDRP